jgi:hypothetical protein
MKTVVVASVLAIAAGSAGDSPATAPRGQHETTPAITVAAVATSLAFEQWIGRSVESSDGKDLGQVSGLNEDDQNEFYVDLGGFLALGETRVRISSDEVHQIKDDRIVLRLTEAEARNLPPADYDEGQQL